MTADHEEDATPAYDPDQPRPPAREPPRRRTAPQSDFSMAQVGFGILVLLSGAIVVFGLPLVL